MRRKKTALAVKPAPKLSPISPFMKQASLLESLVESISKFGFVQTIPSPLEDAKFFTQDELKNKFGDRLLAVASETEQDFILPPTQLLNTLRFYQQNRQDAEPRDVAKWFYIAPVVNYQDGKLLTRQELGIFVLGEDSSLATIHLINAVAGVLNELQATDFVFEISSRGCRSCQKTYHEVLTSQLGNGSSLCADCSSRLESNALAVLDCLNPTCQAVLASQLPPLIDFLDESCRTSLVEVLEAVEELEIPYVLNTNLPSVFPQEKILFRLVAANSENQSVIGQGGNYSLLASRYAGREEALPAIGFLSSLEGLDACLPEDRALPPPRVEVFLIPLGIAACRRVLALHRDLRRAGIEVAETMLGNHGIKNQLKEAVARQAEITLIVGQKEALDETAILRDMRSGMQEVFTLERIIEEVKKRLGE